MGCVGHVTHVEVVRSAYKIKVGEERHLEYRHECEESIKMNLRGSELEGMDCIQLAQDMVRRWAYVNRDMHHWIL
jgi:hypothetical protein